MGTPKTTLKDIAAKCGVSTATVSYVLNGKKGSFAISERSARRILEVSLKNDYRPDTWGIM